MIDKPQMKTELAITWFRKDDRYITFYGSPDSASDLEQFGDIDTTGIRNRYTLTVDARFDFDEVLAYIKTSYVVDA